MTDDARMSATDYMMFIGDKQPMNRSVMTNIEILDQPPDWQRFKETFDRLSRVIPRFRQRVVVPSLPTTAPRWVVDPDFDIDYHLRRTRLAEPGTMRQLLDTVEVFAASPLDVARPLWTTYLYEGLEGGRAAVVSHVSHVITDGVGGLAMAEQMYDLERDGTGRRMPPLPAPGELSPNDLAVAVLKQLPGRAIGSAKSIVGTALTAGSHPLRSISWVRKLAATAGRARAVENSPLLVRRGLARRTVTLQVDLPAFKAAAKQRGGSLNDGFVTALTLALQRYHESRGVPVESIPLAVAVNTRQEGDQSEGNSFSGVVFPAPISEPDITKRMSTIRDVVRGAREEGVVDLAGLVAPLIVNLPGPLLAAMEGTVSMHDIQASNVMSYPIPTYMAGAKVLAQYGVGPVPGVAMMATMVTRDGGCFISTRYDRLAFDDDELWAESLTGGFVDFLGSEDAVSEPDGELTTSTKRTREASSRKPTATKPPATKAPAAKAPAAKPTAAKAPAKKVPAKKVPAKKTTTKQVPARKPTAAQAPAKKPTGNEAAASSALPENGNES